MPKYVYNQTSEERAAAAKARIARKMKVRTPVKPAPKEEQAQPVTSKEKSPYENNKLYGAFS